MEIGREGRELGDGPAGRPGLETVENRRGRTQVFGGALHRLGGGEAAAGVGAEPRADQDLEQRLEGQYAASWVGQETRGAKVAGARHTVV